MDEAWKEQAQAMRRMYSSPEARTMLASKLAARLFGRTGMGDFDYLIWTAAMHDDCVDELQRLGFVAERHDGKVSRQMLSLVDHILSLPLDEADPVDGPGI